MEGFGTLLLAAIALEATIQVLRSFWDENIRKEWDLTRIVLYVVAVTLVFLYSDWNIVAGTGLDIGSNEVVGKVLTGLALARSAQWVHNFHWRTGA